MGKGGGKTATVADIVSVMETVAPRSLAEKWDNCGLQVGDGKSPVRSILVALDPLPDVVRYACDHHFDLLITHHPLLIKPLPRIDFSTPAGSIVRMAAENNLSIFAAHTNLDSAAGGINDAIAEKIGLQVVRVLAESVPDPVYKLVFFVPADYEDKMLQALFQTPAGRIGNYTSCSFRSPGVGTFQPEREAGPFIGQKGTLSQVEEIRLETVVRQKDLQLVIAHLKQHHPYETMAYDVYPLLSEDGPQGIGRVGRLEKAMRLEALTEMIRKSLGLDAIRFVGSPDLMVDTVAVCSGSGSSLMGLFFSSDAQVYLSGDLRYHDARDVETAGRGLIDAGHFGTEHLVVELLNERLKAAVAVKAYPIEVKTCDLEKDPFIYSFHNEK